MNLFKAVLKLSKLFWLANALTVKLTNCSKVFKSKISKIKKVVHRLNDDNRNPHSSHDDTVKINQF